MLNWDMLQNLDGLMPGQLRDADRVLGLLQQYARNKEQAMRYRSQGQLAFAQQYERTCDELYVRLPEWARW